ncbi:MAG TPA: hypothetical protein VHE81_20155 [Lacipirellulaceae bacterium]|nr:hypothetical protein [Lacipirellulaceae bacterium]
MARHEKTPTPRTRQCVCELIKTHFQTRAALAARTGLDKGALSRLLTDDEDDQRPATPQLVGKIVAVLPKKQSVALMTAFLADIAAIAALEHAVTYEVTVKQKVA